MQFSAALVGAFAVAVAANNVERPVTKTIVNCEGPDSICVTKVKTYTETHVAPTATLYGTCVSSDTVTTTACYPGKPSYSCVPTVTTTCVVTETKTKPETVWDWKPTSTPCSDKPKTSSCTKKPTTSECPYSKTKTAPYVPGTPITGVPTPVKTPILYTGAAAKPAVGVLAVGAAAMALL